MVQKRDFTNRGIKMTSYGAKTSRHQQGDQNDLLGCKNVTSSTIVQKKQEYFVICTYISSVGINVLRSFGKIQTKTAPVVPSAQI